MLSLISLVRELLYAITIPVTSTGKVQVYLIFHSDVRADLNQLDISMLRQTDEDATLLPHKDTLGRRNFQDLIDCYGRSEHNRSNPTQKNSMSVTQ